MARPAWRRLREKLTHDSRGGDDRAGLADEEAGETVAQGDVRAEAPGDDEGSLEPENTALVGCFTVIVGLFFISALFISVKAADGQLDFVSLGTFGLLVASVVISVLLAALAWWAGTAWKRRRERPSEVNPPVGRTEDDQNPVAKP
ncbi:hypothetical protein [Streptomyces collinus]|uniref:hypothetical protein n=1 Tax=Streptomyces collinus TaxID=42684 RepID=UPI00332173FE